jgi:hypothetical protein
MIKVSEKFQNHKFEKNFRQSLQFPINSLKDLRWYCCWFEAQCVLIITQSENFKFLWFFLSSIQSSEQEFMKDKKAFCRFITKVCLIQ